MVKSIKLELIKGSPSHFSQGWQNAIDGDTRGWDGTAKVGGDPCCAIFGFSDRRIHIIHKIRLLTDAGIGSTDSWAKEVRIDFSTTRIKPADFAAGLRIEKQHGAWETFAVDSIEAKFVKLTILQPSSGWRQLVEFEVWGRDRRDSWAIKRVAADPDSANSAENFAVSSDKDNSTGTIAFSNYPNPFNERTLISFQLPAASHVQMTIYNIIGEKIVMLVDEWKPAGSYQVSWNGRNDSGIIAPSGIYILQMRTGTNCQSRKLILMK